MRLFAIISLFFCFKAQVYNQQVIITLEELGAAPIKTLKSGFVHLYGDTLRTDSVDCCNGKVVFKDVKPQDVVLRIEAKDYIPLEVRKTVTSVDSNNIFTFQLTKIWPNNFYIYGNILTPDKQGIEGAKIIFNDSISATSNKIGYYLLGIDLKKHQFKADSTAFSVKAKGFKTLNDRIIVKPQVLERNFELEIDSSPPPKLIKAKFIDYALGIGGEYLTIGGIVSCFWISKRWEKYLDRNNDFDVNHRYRDKKNAIKWTKVASITGATSVTTYIIVKNWKRIFKNSNSHSFRFSSSNNGVGLVINF